MDVGEGNSSGEIIIRRVKHPAAKFITEDNISEKIIVDAIVDIFSNKYDNLWFKSRVNLWEYLSNSKSVTNSRSLQVLKELKNPLQPDIDLLYCQKDGYKLQTPLSGVEIKLFSKTSGYDKIVPRTSSWAGYYAGLDEAIALLNFGLDYVYLWHLFVFPSNQFEKLSKKYGSDFAKKIIFDTKVAYIMEYWQMTINTVIQFDLPIGFVPTLFSINNTQGEFEFITPVDFVAPKFNINANCNETAYNFRNSVRELLINNLGIDGIKIRLQEITCEKCQRLYNPTDKFLYCPACGSKLTEWKKETE
jgi:hypothetical protein